MIAQIIKHFHLPNNTHVTDEDVDAILLRSVDGGDGIYGGDVVSIWKYYKKQNDIQEIVTTHPMADLLWYNPDKINLCYTTPYYIYIPCHHIFL